MNKNREIAEIFNQIGDMLDILEDNTFRIRAYKNAARNISELGDDIEDVAERGELEEISGIGTDLADKIMEYLETGKLTEHEKLRKKVPQELAELLGIQGLGPKTLSKLHKELGVQNIQDLEKALKGESILEIHGMGEKKVEDIKRGIEIFKGGKERSPLGVALPLADEVIREIEEISGTEGTISAGSLRRMKETIGDIDILTIADHGEKVIKTFTRLGFVNDVIAAGDTKGSILLKNGIQVDLRVVPPESYGAALVYFTGSKEHNVKLRNIAIRKNLKINEYGVFRGDECIAGETEKEVYGALELPWIPPELREDNGEVESAQKGNLPELVDLGDIRGDLHMHTNWSDGRASIEEMARQAKELGYEYIAITDHSPSSRIANGLSVERLIKKKEELRKIDKNTKGIKILMGTEVDIKSDGSLDYSDDVLEQLDFIVTSVHSGFKTDRESMTDRITTALENPFVHVLGHPTGRLIGERAPYELDIDRVIETAKKHGKAIELNASYQRLDLRDMHVRKAVEAGVKIIISTDAHHPDHMRYMRLGVGTARRGWARKEDVINTMSLKELREWINSIDDKPVA